MSYYGPYALKRDKRLINDFWDILNLQKVGDKYGITRERVRQILEKKGFNSKDIKHAIMDFVLAEKIEREYRLCKCGKYFRVSIRRLRRNRLVDLCSTCFLKLRHKLDKYKWQKKYYLKKKGVII